MKVPEQTDIVAAPAHKWLLGTGGMGEVWRVIDLDLHRDVALKLARRAPGAQTVGATPRLSVDTAQQHLRFLDEVQITAQLQHPGIVPVYRVGRLDDGRTYYTMPVVRGHTLTEVIGALHAATHTPADAAERLQERRESSKSDV
jgi:serine/threonine protein kinase